MLQTNRHTNTLNNDNKGRLKLAARERVMMSIGGCMTIADVC